MFAVFLAQSFLPPARSTQPDEFASRAMKIEKIPRARTLGSAESAYNPVANAARIDFGT
jgi:hypothetical protein